MVGTGVKSCFGNWPVLANPFWLSRPTNLMDHEEKNLNAAVPSDEELARSAQAGEQEAFVLLYERYCATTYAWVQFKIPAMDVEDVTQEIFIAVLKSLGSFRGRSKFSTWIWTITNHKIADYYRSHKLVTVEQKDYEELAENHLSQPAGRVEFQQDDLITIRHALSKLPKNYQDILLMRFVDDLSFNEIALQNGQSLEATKSLFRRSVAALSREIGGENE
jgi:RNA polymerase sigma-70 factor (ECF subfamily)